MLESDDTASDTETRVVVRCFSGRTSVAADAPLARLLRTTKEACRRLLPRNRKLLISRDDARTIAVSTGGHNADAVIATARRADADLCALVTGTPIAQPPVQDLRITVPPAC